MDFNNFSRIQNLEPTYHWKNVWVWIPDIFRFNKFFSSKIFVWRCLWIGWFIQNNRVKKYCDLWYMHLLLEFLRLVYFKRLLYSELLLSKFVLRFKMYTNLSKVRFFNLKRSWWHWCVSKDLKFILILKMCINLFWCTFCH